MLQYIRCFIVLTCYKRTISLSHWDTWECVWHWMFPFHQELRHLDFCASRKSRCIKKPPWHGACGASGFNYRILFSKEKPHKTMFRSNRNVWFNPCGLNCFASHCGRTLCYLCPWTTPKRQKDGGTKKKIKEAQIFLFNLFTHLRSTAIISSQN